MTLESYIQKCMDLEYNFEKMEHGECRIEIRRYEKGSNFAIVPANNGAYLHGDDFTIIKLKDPFDCHRLFHNKEVIMIDSGIEMYNQFIPYLKAKGKVLVGGLGVGMFSKLLCEKENVSEVVTVEFNADVVELCKFEHEKSEIITDDFYEYVRNNDLSRFDYIYIDTYTDTTTEDNYGKIIIPLRKYLIENYPTIPFDFWQEDEFKARYLLKKIGK